MIKQSKKILPKTELKPGKKNHQGEGGGRPPLYSTSEELETRIKDYFNHPPRTRKVVVGKKPNQEVIDMPIFTITGLVLHLGFCDRKSFYNLEAQPKFSHTIKKARTRIECEYEEQITLGNTCAIFALKNFDWKDKQEVEHDFGEKTLAAFENMSIDELEKMANDFHRKTAATTN